MKKWILLIALIIAGLVVVNVGGGYLYLRMSAKNALPQIAGEVAVPGLKEEVEIVRDTYGVPHVFAKNEQDLYFGFGYAMAQDRFWQMEFLRRLGHGKLSEVFGESFVDTDRYFRLITAAGVNRELPQRYGFTLQYFAEGINAYLKAHAGRLPFEFKLLRYDPEPWQQDDYLAVMKVINWGLSSAWEADLVAAEMLEKVGEEKLKEAFPAEPEDTPLIVPQEIKGESPWPQFTRMARVKESLKSIFSPGASNNWVVSGKKTVTGKPILANDPHLGLSNPSIWWEAHLSCPTMNVSGFAIPGIPGFPIGHNASVAWGVTNAMVDDVDFYIEKINPDNPRQYWFNDRWENMKVIEEVIKIKGKEPFKTEILVTRHGPVVNDPKKDTKGRTISARWAYTERLQPVKAGYHLVMAKNLDEAVEALRTWELPSQNFVIADSQGNIGHWYCAAMPIRSRGDGLLPVPGWTGEYEWQGYVPFQQKPHLINPEEGFIATANNQVTGKSYPYVIGRYWEPMDRVARIRQMISAKDRLQVDDIKKMQGDQYCLLASELAPKMIQVLDERFSDSTAKRAKEILRSWDSVMAKESVAASIYEVTYRKMMDNIFLDELGEDLFRKYIAMSSFPPKAIRVMLRRGESPWFDDVRTPEKENMEDILTRSLAQAFLELKEKVGSDVEGWTWGRIHTLTFEHVLAKKKPLDRVFNLGPYAVGGSALTVDKKQYEYGKPYQANHGVSLRMIVDLGNMDAALHVLPTGESGHLASPHHKDQVPLYLEGRYRPALTDRRELEKHTEGKLILKPSKQ